MAQNRVTSNKRYFAYSNLHYFDYLKLNDGMTLTVTPTAMSTSAHV